MLWLLLTTHGLFTTKILWQLLLATMMALLIITLQQRIAAKCLPAPIYTGSLKPRNGSNSSNSESVKPLNGSASSHVESNKFRIEFTSSCIGSTDHAGSDSHYVGFGSTFAEHVSNRDEPDNYI